MLLLERYCHRLGPVAIPFPKSMTKTFRVQGRLLASSILQPSTWMDEPAKYYTRIEPYENQTEEIEEHLRHIKDNGSYGYYLSHYEQDLPPDYVTFGHLVVLQSLFQPRLSGEFLDYTDEVQFSNASVQAVGHLEQMTGGNYFLAFDLLEPFFKA